LSTNESLILADLGCGLGQLEINLKDLKHLKVLSYDLVSSQEHVVACDISKLPLRKRKLDIAVFCLSLMGTNHVDMVKEAHRVLKPKATLIIAEVSSRFTLPDLLENMKLLGFKILKKHIPNTYFSVLLFRKVKPKANSITELFSPCKYKKR
jgi:ubiquinone/menaquinone biosynthesis C-methylase UbiE